MFETPKIMKISTVSHGIIWKSDSHLMSRAIAPLRTKILKEKSGTYFVKLIGAASAGRKLGLKHYQGMQIKQVFRNFAAACVHIKIRIQ